MKSCAFATLAARTAAARVTSTVSSAWAFIAILRICADDHICKRACTNKALQSLHTHPLSVALLACLADPGQCFQGCFGRRGQDPGRHEWKNVRRGRGMSVSQSGGQDQWHSRSDTSTRMQTTPKLRHRQFFYLLSLLVPNNPVCLACST